MVPPVGSSGRSALAVARFWLRLVALPVACFAFMGFALAQSGRADLRVEPLSPRLETGSVRTPLLSIRRLPNVVALPTHKTVVRAKALAALTGLPLERTCASVMNSRGHAVFEHNASLLLSPASNEKVLLAYGALTELGPTRTFTTSLATDAPLVKGSIKGNIWLIGRGDPVLASEDYVGSFVDQQRVYSPFESLADQLVTAGITSIEGKIVADASRYDDVLYHPNWPSRFGANGVVGPISALALDNGFADFSRGGQDMAGSGAPSSNPPLTAAAVLIDLLQARGINVDGGPDVGTAPKASAVIAQLQSPPLKDIAGQMLRTSDNTIAEMLFKELGASRAGQGSFAGGAAALGAILSDQGLRPSGMVISDGSGLDTANLVPCSTLNAVLHASGLSSDLAASLAVAGRSGTLKSRFADSAAAGKVLAKTGTLGSVSSLAGFADTTSGESVTFAIVINESGAEQYKLIEEAFVTSLLDFPGGPAVQSLMPLG